MKVTKVAIVGMGTVGTGVARLLLDHGDRTARHAGRTLWLEKVVIRDINKKRQVDLPEGLLTEDLNEVLDNPEIKVVAQMIGGLEPARTILLKLLESGKDIVTANKALLAEHGAELFDRARELGRSIAFEAAVAGGIPIITNMSQCLSANQLNGLQAILNGTSNFVVTQMAEKGASYDKVIQQAQELGYAEADPTMDVDGTDAAQKLAILAHLGFGARVNWKEIARTGIDVLTQTDMKCADHLGYRIKLLAIAQLTKEGLELHVSPTLVKKGRPLAEVQDANNAISVDCDAAGNLFFYGPGAGQMPTASAIVADMIDTAVGRTELTFETLKLWSKQPPRVNLREPNTLAGEFYLRLTVLEQPGVLSQIAGTLGEHGISIKSILQQEGLSKIESTDGQTRKYVPIVILTHKTSEGASRQAVAAINTLKCVEQQCIRLRVLD
ncbi:MAG: homoserine dehydrogenase [Pirellulaceae bacterium]|nr:homoserine dehydrogenase [Pirellulaceae bacterium]